MDIKAKKWIPGAQGNAASEDAGDYVSRSCSWQYGANVVHDAIEDEKQEEDVKFGVVNSGDVHESEPASPLDGESNDED